MKKKIYISAVIIIWTLSYVGMRIGHVLIHEEHSGPSRCHINSPDVASGVIELKHEVQEHQIWPARSITGRGLRMALTALYIPFGTTEKLAWHLVRPKGSLSDSSMMTVLILRRLCKEYDETGRVTTTELDQWGNMLVVKPIDARIAIISPGPDGIVGNKDDIEEESGRSNDALHGTAYRRL